MRKNKYVYLFLGDVSASTADDYTDFNSNNYDDYNAQDPTTNYDDVDYGNVDYSLITNEDPCEVSLTT